MDLIDRGFLYPRIPLAKRFRIDYMDFQSGYRMCLLLNFWSSLLGRSFSSVFLTTDLPYFPPKKSLHGISDYWSVKRKPPLDSGAEQKQTEVSPFISFAHFAAPETPRNWGPEVRWLVQSPPANWWKSLQSHKSNICFSIPDQQFFSHWEFFFFFLHERKWLL